MKSYKFNINGNSYEVELKEVDENKVHLEVNGVPYNVEIEAEMKKTKTPTIVRQVDSGPRQKEIDRKPGGSSFPVTSPLPGVILKLLVKSGDIVRKGDALCIMEAMKMENSLQAERDGVIENVRVKAGDSVLQGDVLFEIV
jgi:glutaconyl-CoA/methylmalonyl-CoA decarboxylase subunit gamma